MVWRAEEKGGPAPRRVQGCPVPRRVQGERGKGKCGKRWGLAVEKRGSWFSHPLGVNSGHRGHRELSFQTLIYTDLHC